ncbi:DUF4291 domain-containing protein [Fulvivirga sediminis]|uniref:DUF4291 domain-containing protein n=1 Tax=Fulvivirga sediminis TaxID=2803949 RepID=A0A937FDF9_9BACT|nr:DUF4291 domain-containing protein [Fulvivirga sediminis]MBL3658513.1 DUF4291 domain-containing protein [Fulvivirga sediminis]
MKTEKYQLYKERIPKQGQHIIASYDDEGIIVYQAFRPSIAAYAVEHQRFGGTDYSFDRMSWIKPNFLWMMYRAGWATKAGQERILAIKISHGGFENILEEATYSSFNGKVYESHEAWKAALEQTEVRLQWDPDHGPNGEKLERRAIQLGMKGDILKKFNEDFIISIEDVTDFVASQREKINNHDQLLVPAEQVYKTSALLAQKLQLD